jgi:hypothetical protein
MRGELHETQLLVHPLVVVGHEADLIDIQRLGAIHVRHREYHQFERPIHRVLVPFIGGRGIDRDNGIANMTGHGMAAFRLQDADAATGTGWPRLQLNVGGISLRGSSVARSSTVGPTRSATACSNGRSNPHRSTAF